jgi:hypothetical protein
MSVTKQGHAEGLLNGPLVTGLDQQRRNQARTPKGWGASVKQIHRDMAQ